MAYRMRSIVCAIVPDETAPRKALDPALDPETFLSNTKFHNRLRDHLNLRRS
jgi:hypothetical protein